MRIHVLLIGFAAASGLAACGGTSTTVTQTQPAAVPPQVQTVTQIIKTVTQKQQAPAPKPAAASSTSSGGGGGGQTVPSNLVGKNLSDAEAELDGNGIAYTTEGGEVVLTFDWGVCSTTPSAGSPVSGAVVLHVGHFSCGA